jgi:hypothetical protein
MGAGGDGAGGPGGGGALGAWGGCGGRGGLEGRGLGGKEWLNGCLRKLIGGLRMLFARMSQVWMGWAAGARQARTFTPYGNVTVDARCNQGPP